LPTAAADNHSKHEVCDQDKAIISASLAGHFKPGAAGWDALPCDMLHQALPAHCTQNRDPGLPPGWPAACWPWGPTNPTSLPLCGCYWLNGTRKPCPKSGGTAAGKASGAVARYFAKKAAAG
jgi:hypothetical protein